jgi:hypothetical protein
VFLPLNRLNRSASSLILALVFSTASLAAGVNESLQNIQRTFLELCRGDEVPKGYMVVKSASHNLGQNTIQDTTSFRTADSETAEYTKLLRNGHVVRVHFTIWTNDQSRQWFLRAGNDCQLNALRVLLYKNNSIDLLRVLDPVKGTVQQQIPWNPELPDAADYLGIRVAMVDSGVNYQHAAIFKRLARDRNRQMLGYDFWDEDAFPYDLSIGQSEFFPRHHGTRTASLLLDESPFASLIPYRYPKPDMQRMAELVRHAAAHGVQVIGLPIGSGRASDWVALKQAIDKYTEILFVISAGNEGLDIGQTPRYPAVFSAPNVLVVGSVDETPRPASRTNWSNKFVDILVPAERLPAIDFQGDYRLVSGTSYAVSRIVALASRLIVRNSIQSASVLKQRILTMSDEQVANSYAKYGLLFDPLIDMARVEMGETILATAEIVKGTLLQIQIFRLDDTGWSDATVKQAMDEAAGILSQCHVAVQFNSRDVQVSSYLKDFHSITSKTITDQLKTDRPAIFLVRDTLRSIPFEGEAFAMSNTTLMPWLKDTAWLVGNVQHPGKVLAHELVHILLDNGTHSADPKNLMHEKTSLLSDNLTVKQCQSIQQNLKVHGDGISS